MNIEDMGEEESASKINQTKENTKDPESSSTFSDSSDDIKPKEFVYIRSSDVKSIKPVQQKWRMGPIEQVRTRIEDALQNEFNDNFLGRERDKEERTVNQHTENKTHEFM